MNNYWTTRRTIRKYSNKEVTDKLLYDLIEKASYAPTTGTMQLYSVIITRDAEQKAKITPAHFNQPASVNAPVLLTFCADFNRFTRWCEASGADPAYANLQSLMSAILDVTIFAQQFNTLAEMEGLGCCYLGTTLYNAPQISETLGLPSLVLPVLTIAIGYPDEKGAETYRLPIEAIIHAEKYRDESGEDIRTKYYVDIENRDDCKGFVKEHSKNSLAQVFTDIRYPRANNEHFSNALQEFLDKIWLKQ